MRRLILVFLLILTSCSSISNRNESITNFASCSTILTRGMSADGLFLPCLDGKGEVALGSIEGPALITVWASWCTNCESQRPYLNKLYEENKGNFQIIGVDVEEKSREVGAKHALKKGMAYPHLYDPDGRTNKTFGPGIPVTQFINDKGALVFQQIGPFTSYQELTEKVRKYLGVVVT